MSKAQVVWNNEMSHLGKWIFYVNALGAVLWVPIFIFYFFIEGVVGGGLELIRGSYDDVFDGARVFFIGAFATLSLCYVWVIAVSTLFYAARFIQKCWISEDGIVYLFLYIGKTIDLPLQRLSVERLGKTRSFAREMYTRNIAENYKIIDLATGKSWYVAGAIEGVQPYCEALLKK